MAVKKKGTCKILEIRKEETGGRTQTNDEEKENRNTLPMGLNCQLHIQWKRQNSGD